MIPFVNQNGKTIALCVTTPMALYYLYQNRIEIHHIFNRMWTFGYATLSLAQREIGILRASYSPAYEYSQICAELGPQHKQEEHWLFPFEKECTALFDGVESLEEKLSVLRRIQDLNRLHLMTDKCSIIFHGITFSRSEQPLVFSQNDFAKLINAVLNGSSLRALSPSQTFAAKMVWHFLRSVHTEDLIDNLNSDSMQRVIQLQDNLDPEALDKTFCLALESGHLLECKKADGFAICLSNVQQTWQSFREVFQISIASSRCSDIALFYSALIEACSVWILVESHLFFLSELQKLDFLNLTLSSFQKLPLCRFSQKVHAVHKQIVGCKEEHQKLAEYLSAKLKPEEMPEDGNIEFKAFYEKRLREKKKKLGERTDGLEPLETLIGDPAICPHEKYKKFPFRVVEAIEKMLADLIDTKISASVVEMAGTHLCKTLLTSCPLDQEKIHETSEHARYFHNYLIQTIKSLEDRTALCSSYTRNCFLYPIAVYQKQVEIKRGKLVSKEDCFTQSIQWICEKKGETSPERQEQLVELLQKLGFFKRLHQQEIHLNHVDEFIGKLLQNSGQATDILHSLLNARKLDQEGFQQLLQLPLSLLVTRLETKREVDIKKICEAIHEDPFLLVSCLIPALIQSLIPKGPTQRQKLEQLKITLDSFRPIFERSIGKEIQNQSVDPLIQGVLKLGFSGMSEKEFLHDFATPFITFFSAVAKEEHLEETKETLTQQGLNGLVEEVCTAKQLWCGLQGDEKERRRQAIEERNNGRLSSMQEFLLLDLPDLCKGVSIATLFIPLSLPILDTEIGRAAATGFMRFISQASKALTGKTASHHLLDKLKKENPHSLIIRLLGNLEPQERDEVSKKIEEEIAPLLIEIVSKLKEFHNLAAYTPHLEKLRAAIQSSDPTNETEVSKAFASIFVSLLGEIESHYVPVLESLCEAFWNIPLSA